MKRLRLMVSALSALAVLSLPMPSWAAQTPIEIKIRTMPTGDTWVCHTFTVGEQSYRVCIQMAGSTPAMVER